MATSLTTLLIPETQEELINQALQLLASQGFPTTNWLAGSPDRAILYTITSLIADQVNSLIPTITAGGFTDFAQGVWLQFLSQQRFNIDFQEATYTIGDMNLYANSNSGPYTITPEQLIAQFPSGNRYINTNGGTLNAGGSLILEWRSEFTNNSLSDPPLNYTDGYTPSDPPILVTSLPGVSILNPPTAYGNAVDGYVSATGLSTGRLLLTGVASDFHSFSIIINSFGNSGIATWSYALDGGTYTSAGNSVTVSDVGGSGINITLVNGSISPSFNLNDIYTFSAPGSWIITQGRDIETDASLKTRDQSRWSSIGDINNSNVYELLAKEASPQVTNVTVITDGYVTNKVNVLVSGQAGVLPGDVISEVQTYITSRSPITDYPIVYSPGVVDVTIAATVYVNPLVFTSGQAAIQAALNNYMASVGINGTIRIAEIVRAVTNQVGVVDCIGVSVATSPVIAPQASGNIVLGSSTTYQLASFEQDIASSFTFIFV